MSQIIVFLLLGIGAGGLIAGIGMGVVLSYRGAGVINLATGAIAMLAGYFFWSIRTGKFATIPAVPAVVLTLIFAVIVGVYRWTRIGLGARAAGENEGHAMFTRLSPNWLPLANTMPPSLLMGITGLLGRLLPVVASYVGQRAPEQGNVVAGIGA